MSTTTVFSQHYPINTSVLNINGRLGLVGALTLVQDISILHPETFGQTYQTCIEKGYFWALSQQQFRMQHWPMWHDTLTIQTWVREITNISAIRECALFLGNQRIGECSMLLVQIDIKKRRPKRISDANQAIVAESTQFLDFKTEKIKLPESLSLASQHTVRISDLDFNQHVNNTKYAEWLLNSLPIDIHHQHTIGSYEINFLAETLLGDEVNCYSDFSKTASGANTAFHFCGERLSDNKKLFTAKITPT